MFCLPLCCHSDKQTSDDASSGDDDSHVLTGSHHGHHRHRPVLLLDVPTPQTGLPTCPGAHTGEACTHTHTLSLLILNIWIGFKLTQCLVETSVRAVFSSQAASWCCSFHLVVNVDAVVLNSHHTSLVIVIFKKTSHDLPSVLKMSLYNTQLYIFQQSMSGLLPGLHYSCIN